MALTGDIFAEISNGPLLCGFPTSMIELDWTPGAVAEVIPFPGYDGPRRITMDHGLVKLFSPCAAMNLMRDTSDLDVGGEVPTPPSEQSP